MSGRPFAVALDQARPNTRSLRIRSIGRPGGSVEIPEPVRGIAEQHRAGSRPPRSRASCRCRGRIGEHDRLGPSAPRKSPAENTLTPETLRLVASTLPGRRARAPASRRRARAPARRRARPGRSSAAMLGAFADRVDAGDAGGEMVIDHDAAVDRDAGRAARARSLADAGRDHDRVAAMCGRRSASSTPSTRCRRGSRGLALRRTSIPLLRRRASAGARRRRGRAGAPSAGPSGGRRDRAPALARP